MMHARVAAVSIERIARGKSQIRQDVLAIEEPLEIRVEYEPEAHGIATAPIGITLRTPGHDNELAAGFLFGEGVLKKTGGIVQIMEGPPASRDKPFPTAVTVRLAAGIIFDPAKLVKNVMTTSSCGACGAVDLVHLPLPHASESIPFHVDAGLITRLPERLRSAQTLFQHTGGLHAAGLFAEDGELVAIREDIGRHNAMDKLIGWGFLEGALPFSKHLVFFSGRVSFDLMQKAIAAGLRAVASIGPPSSLAVELAERYNVTLIGFIREDRFNVYAHGARVTSPGGPVKERAERQAGA
jgi:FdhD protein